MSPELHQSNPAFQDDSSPYWLDRVLFSIIFAELLDCGRLNKLSEIEKRQQENY